MSSLNGIPTGIDRQISVFIYLLLLEMLSFIRKNEKKAYEIFLFLILQKLTYRDNNQNLYYPASKLFVVYKVTRERERERKKDRKK